MVNFPSIPEVARAVRSEVSTFTNGRVSLVSASRTTPCHIDTCASTNAGIKTERRINDSLLIWGITLWLPVFFRKSPENRGTERSPFDAGLYSRHRTFEIKHTTQFTYKWVLNKAGERQTFEHNKNNH